MEKSLNVTNKVLQSNAYLAHPEDLLLVISTDNDSLTRQRALKLIRKTRSSMLKKGMTTESALPQIKTDDEEDHNIIE